MAYHDQNTGKSFWNYLGGGSVFISHSHKDLPKVRLIRNYLEEKGFDPLCFYMQCLTDEDEIEGLLKKEIDARDWFAFMESPNSLQSAWVKKERDYIRNSRDKKIIHYNLQENSPKDIANQIADYMTVYVCYSARERQYGRPLAKALSNMEFRVYDRCGDEADDLLSPDSLMRTEEAIRKAGERGCFLYLMTEKSKQALIMHRELEYAIMYGARIVVAFLGVSEGDIPLKLRYLIRNAACTEIGEDMQAAAEQIATLIGQTLHQNDG